MQRRIATLAVVFMLSFGLARQADAGVPIPCTGESVVTVKEAPAAARTKMHLGYKFSGCSGGEWVGYTGSGSRYYNLNEAQLAKLIVSVGLRELPSPPSFLLTPSASWYAWLWIVIGIVIAVCTGFAEYAKRFGPADLPSTSAARTKAQNPASAGFGRRG